MPMLDGLAPYLPPQHALLNQGGFLTGPSAGSAMAIARNYLASHAADLGLTALDLDSATVTRDYVSDLTGTTHLTFQQSVHGLAVANAQFTVNVSARGQIINIGGGFVPLSGRLAAKEPRPSLSAVQAVEAAARTLGLTPALPARVLQGSKDITRATVLAVPGVSTENVSAHLQYVATPGGAVLVWNMDLRTPDGRHWYNANVDATTGALVSINDWTRSLIPEGSAGSIPSTGVAGEQPGSLGDGEGPSYNVFARPVESPSFGDRSIEINPSDPLASPSGWHDTRGGNEPEFTDTRGNNVDAAFVSGSTRVRPNGGSSLTFDFPLNLTQAPSSYRNAAITNLFYWNNILHDVHYRYGFTEAAGNFQVNNFGQGGLGNDAVRANAQATGFNNAFMTTPPDGTAPTMDIELWNHTVPNRDGDLDNVIPTVEYGFGVTSRLSGNGDGFTAFQSRFMQLGWGDWWGLMFTQRSADEALGPRGLATYVLGQPTNGRGIRTYRYSFDQSIDPLTLRAFNTDPGFGFQVWTSALWDMTYLLTQKEGYNPDISGGYIGKGDAGNILALRLIMDGLKLQPINPSFLEARDAILAADTILTGGAEHAEIWEAFARRGMGFSARDGGAQSQVVSEAFDMPNFAGPYVYRSTISGPVCHPVDSVRLTFNTPIDPKTFTPAQVLSFVGPQGPAIPVTAVTPVEGTHDAQFDITFPRQTTLGHYTLVLSADIRDQQGRPMDQNLNGIAGEVPDDEYVLRFTLQPPRIVNGGPTNINYDLPISTAFVVFDQPIDVSTFTPDKISFIGPRGPISITSITPGSPSSPFRNAFDIHYPEQGATGTYLMIIGPDIRNPAGWRMEQEFILHFGLTGPRITAGLLIPSFNVLPGQASTLRVQFNRPMDPATFTPDKVASFTDPNGDPVTVTAVQVLSGTNNTVFDVRFAPLGITGSYTIVIGPDIRDRFRNPMDQDDDLVGGEVPDDQFTAHFNVGGPRILSAGPLTSFMAVDHIRVTFNEPMDPNTFTTKQIASFIGPDGAIPVSSIMAVSGSNDTAFDIAFPAQDTPGSYRMVIGPYVRDRFGNAMDQDGDFITGEIPDDQYPVDFWVGGTVGPEGFGYQGTVEPFQDLELWGQPGTFTVLDESAYTARAFDLGQNRFNFYGHSYTGDNQLFVTTSGYISFGTRSVIILPTDMTSSPPDATIAPLWERWNKGVGDPTGPIVLGMYDDFDPDGVPHRLILEWNRVDFFGRGDPITFQLILGINSGNDMGDIVFNYPNLQQGGEVDEGNNCTVGIKDVGVQGDNRLVVNELGGGRSPFVGTGLALRFHKDSSKFSAVEPRWPLFASATPLVPQVPTGPAALAPSDKVFSVSPSLPELGQLPSRPSMVDALFARIHGPKRDTEFGLSLGDDVALASRPAWDSLENLT
jgi:hypothetical protein